MQVSGTFQSLPGPVIAANYNAPFAVYGPSLGRVISGGNANSTVQVNLVPPGTLYGERLNQLDLRVGKIVKVGRTRTAFNVDLYNALNVEPGHRGERDLQRRTDRDADSRVARAAIDPDGALREVQRAARFLNLKAVAGEDVKRKGRRDGRVVSRGRFCALRAETRRI